MVYKGRDLSGDHRILSLSVGCMSYWCRIMPNTSSLPCVRKRESQMLLISFPWHAGYISKDKCKHKMAWEEADFGHMARAVVVDSAECVPGQRPASSKGKDSADCQQIPSRMAVNG